MAAASSLLSEDQFLCSICLDVFTDPTSTPCGHNFCLSCITQHWDLHDSCECLNCKKTFHTRPELQVNTWISEMVAHFRQSADQRAGGGGGGSEQPAASPGEVPCDICTGTKLKALKSCLMCPASYCRTHLEPHLTASPLKKHQLINPVENLEGRMCRKHGKLLELFCKDEQECICMFCTLLDHKTHNVVPLKDAYEGKMAELGKIEDDLQQKIRERQLKMEEIKQSIEASRGNADRDLAEGVQLFTTMKNLIEQKQTELTDTIENIHTQLKEEADGFITEIEQEISELKKRSSDLEQLSNTEDQLHFLQKFPAMTAVPLTRKWTSTRIRLPSYGVKVKNSVARLDKALAELARSPYVSSKPKTISVQEQFTKLY